MRRQTQQRFSTLCKALVLLAILTVPGTTRYAVGEVTTIHAEIQETGDVRVWESDHPGTNFDESLSNLAYAWGGMQWWLEPIVTMLPLVFNTEDGSSPLNIDATEAFLSAIPSTYRSSVLSSLVQPQLVDTDGTVERTPTTRQTIEQIHAWIVRLNVPDDAEEVRRLTNPVNIRLLERWLAGAQNMAALHEEEFYQAHPVFRDTNIIAAFRSRTVQHVLQNLVVGTKLYDVGAILSPIRGAPAWINSEPLGTALLTLSSSQRQALPKEITDLPLAKPLGASNGGAFTYVPSDAPSIRKCVTVGEPHQPSHEQDLPGPQARAKIFHIYPKNDAGEFQPLLFMAQGGSATPMLNYSEFHGTSGTAGPSMGSLNFFSPTDGVRYQSENGQWAPLERRVVSYQWRNETRSYTLYSVPNFGEVFARIKDPINGGHYVITRRPKTIASVANAFFDRLRYGARNDSARYLATIKDGGLSFYGEAGCHPTDPLLYPGEHGRAYFALNQGRSDIMANEIDAASDSVLPTIQGYRKLGSHDTAVCANALWASSDNGSLAGGCPGTVAFSKLRDPGFPTFRQVQFRDWSIANVESGRPLTREEIVQFGSSTNSYSVKQIARLMAYSVQHWGPSTIPPAQLASAQAVAAALQNYDGYVRDDVLQIGIFHILINFTNTLLSFTNPILNPLVLPMLNPVTTEAQLQALVTEPVGAVLNQFVINALDFYITKCAPLGITRWAQVTKIVASGEQVGSGFAGPSAEARNSGAFQFDTVNGEQICSARLTGTSPFSFIAFDDAIYYRTFGPPVSPHTLEPGLYQTASARSWALISQINRSGSGSSDLNAYRRFSFSGTPSDPPVAPVVKSYTFQLETSSPQELQNSLHQAADAIRKLLKKKTSRAKRNGRKQVRLKVIDAEKVLRLYTATTLRLSTLEAAQIQITDALGKARSAARPKAKRAALKKALRRLTEAQSAQL